eukprot:CAMPEP_0203893108 /NCGR_PEP_ID=MMETSP0359-20131031/36221_1 /ASSEMBLY_ACC=CAM_ASM_000338 /TAXON_ID=268821 /ORGANISM="Scrippsiella Hangoei, Strain SHTV-5" /LENGTH=336 /DNA_ID=CAMNT_0050815201 /DNA_START=99 /DNA_END=1110 /DNA_ORIENTATION=+
MPAPVLPQVMLDHFEVQGQGRGGPCPMCRRPLSVFSLVQESSGEPLARPEVSTIFGQCFYQHGGLGIASYHFDSEEDCYISYSEAPANWRLDDRSRPPARKPFLEHSWDPATRTFRGRVEWDPKFSGNSRWDYEMVFADDFSSIVGGSVTADQSDVTPFCDPWSPQDGERGLHYLRWVPPPESIFGGVYIQGPAYRHSAEGIASYHFVAEDVCYISYASAPSNWRLDDGSMPPARKPFTETSYDSATRTFRGTVSWDPPWQGDVRWEYVMAFSEDFEHIDGGSMTPFDASGSPKPPYIFCTERQIRHVPKPLLYTRKPQVLMAVVDIPADIADITI